MSLSNAFHKMKVQAIALVLSLLVASLSIPVTGLVTEYDFSYDERGNLQQGVNEYFEYNELNQLVKVRQGDSSGSILEEYAYDQEGERIKKHDYVLNETTYYVNDNFVVVMNETGNYTTTHYYDDETQVGRKDPNGDKFYYHPDHLGSTAIVTNQSGDVVEETLYEPYGEILSGGDSRFLYTGKELDDQSGLYYYGARYYDSFLTRFTQPDENIPDPYNPQDLNRYSYVRNNPYKYVDPTGDIPIDVIVDVGFIAYGIYKFTQSPSLKSAGEVGLDVAFAFVPFLPNIKRGKELAKALSKAEDVRDIGKVSDASKLSPQEIGKLGEEKLAKEFGGDLQKPFKTPLGERRVDQFSGETIRESKVGYKSLDKRTASQINKDVSIINDPLSGAKRGEYHFFRSPVTSKIGPSKPLQSTLNKAGIKTVKHTRSFKRFRSRSGRR